MLGFEFFKGRICLQSAVINMSGAMPFTLKILVYGFFLGKVHGSQMFAMVVLWKMKCKNNEDFQDLIQCK